MRKILILCSLLASTGLFGGGAPIERLSSGHDYSGVSLYRATAPYDEGYLAATPVHQIYYAQYGNPDGVPVLVVHGGPGWGCSDLLSRFFDPLHYRIVMFDQRGAMRSQPFIEMEDNTPFHSVGDMELLREKLGIDKWILFGGSYGSALSILYGEHHPERCLGFVLRGIFLMRKKDYEHLLYGMRKTFPEAWHEFVNFLPEDERNDLLAHYHRRVMDPDPETHLPASRAFMKYDTTCAMLLYNSENIDAIISDDRSIVSISRAFIHYAAHGFFLEGYSLLENIDRIAHLPCFIVHGRYDTICPAETAFELFQKWPGARLWFVPDAGHSTNDLTIAKSLKVAMEEMKNCAESE